MAALVVADDAGLVLATTGATEAAEEIVGRLAIRRDAEFQGKVQADGRAWEVYMHRLVVDGASLLCAAIGGTKQTRSAALAALVTGARRILGTAPALA